MKIPTVTVLAALLAAAAPVACTAEPVLLQYKFEPKEVLKYRLNMATEAKFQTPDGSERTTHMKSYMELSQELLEKKPDGTYRVAVTITKAEQTVDGKAAQLQIAVGTAMLLTMKPNGQVVESAADMPSAGGQPQLQMLFPDKPVADADTWEQTGKIKEPIPMETVTKYAVDSLAAEMPGYDGKLVSINSNMAMNQEKTPTGEEVASKTEGKIWFDAARGRIVQSKAKSTFHIGIPINLQGILPPNSRVKIDFKIDIDISLVK
jgi:hypothetical protein